MRLEFLDKTMQGKSQITKQNKLKQNKQTKQKTKQETKTKQTNKANNQTNKQAQHALFDKKLYLRHVQTYKIDLSTC